MLRFVCASLLCGLLLAQQTPPPAAPDVQDSRFVVGVDRVGHSDDLREHGADVVVTDLEQLLEERA